MSNNLKWVEHLGKSITFGYEGRKRKGNIEGYHPLWGVVVFEPSNVLVPYHYVREELIDWPEGKPKEGTEPLAQELRERFNEEFVSRFGDNTIEYKAKEIFQWFTPYLAALEEGRDLDVASDKLINEFKRKLGALFLEVDASIANDLIRHFDEILVASFGNSNRASVASHTSTETSK